MWFLFYPIIRWRKLAFGFEALAMSTLLSLFTPRYIKAIMKPMYSERIKTFLLSLFAIAVILDGLFFGAYEAQQFSTRYNFTCESVPTDAPLQSSLTLDSTSSYMLNASEVKDVTVLHDIVKKLEMRSGSKRIVILSLILCILLTEGSFFSSVLPSLFPWTNTIVSRVKLINYIHHKDGKK